MLQLRGVETYPNWPEVRYTVVTQPAAYIMQPLETHLVTRAWSVLKSLPDR